jgi:hypothetical protein
MPRILASYIPAPHSKILMGGEPLVFHCNYYNYFLQKTVLLDEQLGMEAVIHDAALASVYALLTAAMRERDANTPAARRQIAQDTFAQLGFGLMDLGEVGPEGGHVTTPMSHYGFALRPAAGNEFAHPPSYFDAGYAAAASAVIHGRPVEAFTGTIEACIAMGAPAGRIAVTPRTGAAPLLSPGIGAHTPELPVPPFAATSVDEPAILAALATLDFAGNDEGLVPRFGVMLTHHFANFYNRMSFEFIRRMADTGLLEGAEDLLVEAGLRCAFHTFGGIMTSGEWDAVIKPQCQSREDLVHGMVATVNALGWGTWRVIELAPDRLVVRIYDDYESCGYLGMYGKATRPVSHLAAGGVAGLMNLVYVARIDERPTLDLACYTRVFESPERFTARHGSSMAMGDGYTEIVASR